MPNKISLYLLGVGLLVLLFFISILCGFYSISFKSVVNMITAQYTAGCSTDSYIFYQVRLPRTCLAIIMGSGLAISGASLQGMFKNPLATPGIIGITSGSALFAAISIVLGNLIKGVLPQFLHYSLISFSAFFGALLVMFLVYKISLKDGKTRITIMLLAGVAITALAGSIIGFLTFISTDDELRDLIFWNLGSLSAANWNKVIILFCINSIAVYFLSRNGKALNVMMLNEENAQHLGINVKKHHAGIIWLTSIMVGASVAFAGTIGFVGLIVPYILRLAIKPDYRIILPLSALYGGILLLAADIFCRTVLAPSEIPIGIITAFMGAPIFIIILIRFKKLM